MKVISNVLILLFGTLFIFSAFAQKGEHHEHKIFESLNLTAEQKGKIEKIMEEEKANMQSFKKEMHAKMDNFKQTFASNASKSDVEKSHKPIKDMHEKMADSHFKVMLKIREVLSPEQRKKFIEKKHSMMMDKEKMHDKGMMNNDNKKH